MKKTTRKVMSPSVQWSLMWWAWTIFILMVGILPLSNFVGHSHWEYIHWVPSIEQLQSPLIVLDLSLDMLANILLFVPFGFFYAGRLQQNETSLAAPIGLAFLLSFSIGLYQVYCHNRSTSLLDLIDNVAGAYVGLRVGMQFFRTELVARPEPTAPLPRP